MCTRGVTRNFTPPPEAKQTNSGGFGAHLGPNVVRTFCGHSEGGGQGLQPGAPPPQRHSTSAKGHRPGRIAGTSEGAPPPEEGHAAQGQGIPDPQKSPAGGARHVPALCSVLLCFGGGGWLNIRSEWKPVHSVPQTPPRSASGPWSPAEAGGGGVGLGWVPAGWGGGVVLKGDEE